MALSLSDAKYRFHLPSKLTLHFIDADIVELAVDGIVSSDDTWLSMGGGVSRRIAEVGGEELTNRLSRSAGQRFEGHAEIGEVFWSPAGNLLSEYVLHTAIVDWRQDLAATRETVLSTASQCMRIARSIAADEARTKGSIAFPLMGTGAGGLSVIDSLVALIWAAHDVAEEPGLPLDVVLCFWFGGPEVLAWESVAEGIVAVVQRPAARGQSSVQALGAIAAPDRVADVILRAPAPVAVPAFQAMQEVSQLERLRAAIDAGEALVRFLTAVSLSTDQSKDRAVRLQFLLSVLGKQPTLGRWVEALRTNLGKLRSFDESFVGVLVSPTGKRTRAGELLLQELPEVRNKTIGHASPLPDQAYEPLVAAVLDPIIEALEGLNLLNFRLLAPISHDWGEGDSVRYVMRILEGPYSVFPTTIVQTASDPKLRTRHVLLQHQRDPEAWFDIDPIVTFAVCPTCQRDDVFFYDRSLNERSLDYRSFISGHGRGEHL